MYSLQKLEFEKVLRLIAQYTFSSYGKEAVLSFQPIDNPELELTKVSQLIDLFRRYAEPPVGGIADIRREWARVSNGEILEPGELKRIAANFDSVARLKQFFEGKTTEFPFLNPFLSRFHTLEEYVKFAFRAIEDDESISSRASPRLNQIRQDLKRAMRDVKGHLDKLMSGSLKEVVQDNDLLTRDGRFVIPIKAANRHRVSGIVHSSSGSGATYYMEPETLVPLNDAVRNLYSQEREEINRILRELCQMLLQRAQEIESTIAALVEWDSLWARARFAIDQDAVIPEISSDCSFTLKEAKHPLIGKRCVPLSLSLSDTLQGIVITGPNTGGKTVSLKTVGLCHLMGLSGIPVCAATGTRLGRFAHVLVDIGDEQSIEQSLSTFSSHMKNIIAISEKAGPESLVLLDELGAGTDPVEGSAIALGILDVFLERGAKLLVSSHMTPLKLYAYQKKELENASVIFNVDDLRPTFQLVVGLAGSSNALIISERLGLSNIIIERARSFLDKDVQRIDEVLNLLHRQKIEMEEQNSRIRHLRETLERQQMSLEKQLEEIKQKKYGAFLKEIESMEEELREIRRYTQTRVAEFRKEKQQHPGEVESFNREVQGDITQKIAELRRNWEGSFKQESREAEIERLKPGDCVLLKDSKLVLRVIENKASTILVEKDGKKLEIPKSFIDQKTAPPSLEPKKEWIQENTFQEDFIGDRLDIRGKTVEEGINELEAFISFLLMKNRKTGCVIHGKGTGKLADGLWQKFAKDRRIQTYRIGKPEEGGTGVTIITLS
ncbi:MAG TPA: Smr/MutS family protein [Thermotogota bacterium]|nr:Smr/MutS family protein [Thermotogota bacterium]HPM19891.1 Smr/MutS family protein [Thermotogota bacterium]